MQSVQKQEEYTNLFRSAYTSALLENELECYKDIEEVRKLYDEFMHCIIKLSMSELSCENFPLAVKKGIVFVIDCKMQALRSFYRDAEYIIDIGVYLARIHYDIDVIHQASEERYHLIQSKNMLESKLLDLLEMFELDDRPFRNLFKNKPILENMDINSLLIYKKNPSNKFIHSQKSGFKEQKEFATSSPDVSQQEQRLSQSNLTERDERPGVIMNNHSDNSYQPTPYRLIDELFEKKQGEACLPLLIFKDHYEEEEKAVIQTAFNDAKQYLCHVIYCYLSVNINSRPSKNFKKRRAPIPKVYKENFREFFDLSLFATVFENLEKVKEKISTAKKSIKIKKVTKNSSKINFFSLKKSDAISLSPFFFLDNAEGRMYSILLKLVDLIVMRDSKLKKTDENQALSCTKNYIAFLKNAFSHCYMTLEGTIVQKNEQLHQYHNDNPIRKEERNSSDFFSESKDDSSRKINNPTKILVMWIANAVAQEDKRIQWKKKSELKEKLRGLLTDRTLPERKGELRALSDRIAVSIGACVHEFLADEGQAYDTLVTAPIEAWLESSMGINGHVSVFA